MTEWNFAHHLANEIAKYIFWLNHDIDVVKRNMNNHRPDIIFHKRGYNNMNFLVIEIKIGRNLSRDIKRIKEDWMSNPLKYRFGASIKIDRSNEEDWEFTLFDRDGNANLFKSNSFFSPSIPKIPESAQQSFIDLVDKILAIKHPVSFGHPSTRGEYTIADTSHLEHQIDQMVYELYGLTEEEIKMVEGRDENLPRVFKSID